MQKQRLISNLLLMLAALIWGVSFVAASVAANNIGAFTLNCLRSFIGCTVLLPVIRIMDGKRRPSSEETGGRDLWKGGIACGVVLTVAVVVQQAGLAQSTAGKSGFLTALYIIIVPFLGIFFGRKPSLLVCLAALIGLAGIYLLSVTEQLTIGCGELLVILSSLAFSAHILIIDHYSPRVSGVRLSFIQFFVCGVLCLGPMLLIEKPSLSALTAAAVPILYMGVLSSGVAYTLQIVAQKHTEPVVASLACSMESVFAALAGWAILHETMSGRELFGCVLVFAAILVSQLPARPQKNVATGDPGEICSSK